jgi:chromosomal replication initiator protein
VPKQLTTKYQSYHSKRGYEILIEEIMVITCKHFKISRLALFSSERRQEITKARQVSMFLAKHITNKSLKRIGKSFGKNDHTYALGAVKKIGARTVADIEFAYDVAKLEAAIRGSVIV